MPKTLKLKHAVELLVNKIDTERNLGDTMKHSSKITIFTLALGALLVSGVVAKADSLSLTITPSGQTVAAGSLTPLVFYATVTNNDSSTIDLNADNINISLSSATPTINLPATDVVDDSSFVYGWPLSLNPGDSYTGELFALTISDPTTVTGLYEGTFQITDGSSPNPVELGTADFSFTVTPEPSSLLLMITGLAGFVGAVRRKIIA